MQEQAWKSVHQNKKLRAAVRNMLMGQEFDYFLTFAFNKQNAENGIGVDGARQKLKAWHARLERRLLGARWAHKQLSERTFFVGFVENLASNLHYHVLLRTPPACLVNDFQALSSGIWSDVVPSGDLLAKPLHTPADRKGVITYVTKALWQGDLLDNFLISTEFSTRT